MKQLFGFVLCGVWFFIVGVLTVFFVEEVIDTVMVDNTPLPVATVERATPAEEVDLFNTANPTYFELSDEERAVAENIVMGEAGGESFEGQVLVAQCLVNAAIKDGLQPSEVRTKYKYSGWNDKPSYSVKAAVSLVFDHGEKFVEEPVTYFYAPARVDSDWHESLTFVTEVGGHRFFKE